MAKLAHILLLVLIVSAYSNDTIDFIRCFYRNFVPNIELVFNLIDAIKAQDWLTVITMVSSLYSKIKDIISICKKPSLYNYH